jgi:hypothetical protein
MECISEGFGFDTSVVFFIWMHPFRRERVLP